jgi:hypothetical protein
LLARKVEKSLQMAAAEYKPFGQPLGAHTNAVYARDRVETAARAKPARPVRGASESAPYLMVNVTLRKVGRLPSGGKAPRVKV